MTKIYKTIRIEDIEMLTRQGGWTLERMFQQTVVTTVDETIPNPHYNPEANRNDYQLTPLRDPVLRLSRPHVETREYALITKEGALINREEMLDAQLGSAQTALYLAKDQLAKAVKQTDDMQVQINEMGEKHRSDQAAIRAAANQNRQLEADLAKIRGAIGDLKWTEIIGR